MSKKYTSDHLVQKYKNIVSMLRYHERGVSEIGIYAYDVFLGSRNSLSFEAGISEQQKYYYHVDNIKNFKEQLEQLLLRSDFNEEYALHFLQENQKYEMSIIGNDNFV